jgi:hypothetical protein
MKKLACLILVICISVATFAKGTGRRYVASLDNSSVVKSQKDQRRALKSFGSNRRYSSVTRGHGLHLFGGRGKSAGASRPESGLGL